MFIMISMGIHNITYPNYLTWIQIKPEEKADFIILLYDITS